MPRCDHYSTATMFAAPSDIPGCPQCLEQGDTWLHLRMCLVCGHVGCCDSSPNQHARRHQEAGNHHLIRSIEPGEEWAYCYVHDQFTRLQEPETLR